ncbi:Detoxification-like protein [Thalictrum thalictroides]|uniref:Protein DETOXIFICATION n=1 Tax=Thalictrum thalictroides TaxID=46969 RepID=A0A7J6VD62_THATH|nr:Detoxification-like protein [Thalictrum thalictroides]
MDESSVVNVTESLLQYQSDDDDDDSQHLIKYLNSDSIEEILGQKNIPAEWWALLIGWEIKQQWSFCGTYIIVALFNLMLSTVTQMIIGHQLGAMDFAAASMAILEIQNLGFIVMSGMAIAVQTLCAEASGAKKLDSLGTICQKAILVQLAAASVLSIFYWYSGTILETLGLWSEIADKSQLFALGLIPQLYAYAFSFPMQRFLLAQNIMNPLAYIAVTVLLLHLVLTWVVVVVFNYGLIGAALTLSFSWWLLVIMTGVYILVSPSCQKTWTGFSATAFSGLWAYSKLALPSIFMLSFETWYSVGLVLSAAYFADPTVSVASFAICVNYLNCDFTLMLGLSTAAIVRAGTEIESGHPRVARLSAMVVSGTSILISIICSALVLACGPALSKAFINDAEVLKTVSDFVPLLAISIFLNGIEPILSGVVIGCGRPGLVVLLYFCNYYIIGFTFGYSLAFMTNLGVAGIWWGVILGYSVQALGLLILFMKTNWDKAVDNGFDSSKRSRKEEVLHYEPSVV